VLNEGFVQEGFAVTTVTSAKALGAALKSAGPDSTDLIILDIDLPDMNGVEIARKLKENSETKDIPIMFLSALFSKEQEREYGSMLGGNILFTKPYDMNELVIVVKMLVSDKNTVLLVDDEEDVLKTRYCLLTMRRMYCWYLRKDWKKRDIMLLWQTTATGPWP
jgi:DNA-binding response OmpR family regulator